MKTKTKLPPGWEHCRTGIKGVRKWRNMATKCWVTDCADDPDMLHCGVRGVPSKRPRFLYTPEQAMSCIDSECADYAETPDAQINWSLRRQAAEVLLDFWQDEFCTHNDGNARVQMDRAHAMLGDVNQAEHESSPNAADDARPKAVASGSLFDGPANDSK